MVGCSRESPSGRAEGGGGARLGRERMIASQPKGDCEPGSPPPSAKDPPVFDQPGNCTKRLIPGREWRVSNYGPAGRMHTFPLAIVC